MDRPLISRRQERKQKSYLQRDMCLALVSRELRTPTNAIVGWARLIKGGYADERTLAQGIDVIERNARFQAELIGGVVNIRLARRRAHAKITVSEDAVSLQIFFLTFLSPSDRRPGIKRLQRTAWA